MQQILVTLTPKYPRVPIKVVDTLITLFIEFSVLSTGSVVLPTVFERGSTIVILLGSVAAGTFATAAVTLSWKMESWIK